MSDQTERVGRVRRGSKRGGFTVVQNDLIHNPELSIEARALMIYLLSRPDDWELRISDVRRFLGKAGKPCGRDKAYGVVRELKLARYLVMIENVHDGHFAGVTYLTFEEPAADPDHVKATFRNGEGESVSPLPENPETGPSPLPDFPDTENQHATNKRYIINTNPPSPPNQRLRTRRKGSGEGHSAQPSKLPVTTRIAEPWSPEWVQHRINLLVKGRERAPDKPSKFIGDLIRRGGEAGERARLELQARSCWPTVNRMDLATEDARGWAVPIEIFDQDLPSLYRSVAIDSDEFHAWQDAHLRRGWPMLPTPRHATKVWLPAAGLAALEIRNAEEPQEAVA